MHKNIVRTRTRTRLAISIFLVSFFSAGAGWVPSVLPTERIWGFAYDDTFMYAASYESGVYRSADSGKLWALSNREMGSRVHAVAVSGGHVFAGTNWAAHFSNDCGAHWQQADTTYFKSETVYCFLVCGDTVYSGTGKGVVQTTDGGATWRKLTTGLPEANFMSLTRSNDGTLLTGSWASGVFRSIDNGESWSVVTSGLPSAGTVGSSVASFATANGLVFAGTDGKGIFRSSDDGEHWEPSGSGLPDSLAVYALAVSENGTVFAGTDHHGVYRSTDGGTSWAGVTDGLPQWDGTTRFYAVKALSIVDKTAYAGTDGRGAYAVPVDGTAWKGINCGLSQNEINSIVNRRDTLFAGCARERGVFISVDAGASWSSFNNGLGAGFFSNKVSADDKGLFAISDTSVFRYDVTSGSWTTLSAGRAFHQPRFNALVVNGSLVVAATADSGTVRSTDNGERWDRFSRGLACQAVKSLTMCDEHLFAGTYLGGIFVSTDSGATWSEADSGLPIYSSGTRYGTVVSMCSSEGIVYAGLDWAHRVYRSTDYGKYWAPAADSIPGRYPNPVSVIRQYGTLFVGASTGVYYSSGDPLWKDCTEGLPPEITTVAISAEMLVVGTAQDGIWRRPLSELGIDVTGSTTAKHAPVRTPLKIDALTLSGGTMTVSFTQDCAGPLSLDVVSPAGAKVLSLQTRPFETGIGKCRLPTANLSSGLYIVHLRSISGSFFTRRILIYR